MNDLTSEKIAKALKGAGLSAEQRIVKANEAWKNNAIFFPNKDDFLLEWICSAFAKPNMKKMSDCCLIQLPYWTLLVDLLEHYKEKSQLDPNRSPPTIHVNLVSSVSTLLQQLYKSQFDKKKEFLVVARRCLEILFSNDFSLSYRPAYEHVSVAVDQVILSLTTQIDICKEKNEIDVLNELASIAQVLLKKFDSQLILAANQKKVFSSIVEKSLPKLLSVRRRVVVIGDQSNISGTITDIVCHALFHADTVLEFTSVLKDANNSSESTANVKQTNYVVKLFETLESMVNNTKDSEQMLDALDIMPVLFSSFLEAFRQKRNTSTSTLQDISRMAEFGIFVYLSKIIEQVKEKAVPSYLQTLCRLLRELLQWNVYSARNDDIAKSQQEVLIKFVDDIVVYVDDPKRYNQDLVLDLADILLQIDFSLIENRIQSLWPVMLNSEDPAQNSCFKFAKSILNTYAASRQLDVFVQDLIQYVGQLNSKNVFELLKKPMFTKAFLKEFSSLIAKSMPAAQALGIFKNFEESLIPTISKATDDHVDKKQKKTENENDITTATLITVYFVEFTNALKLNQHQLRLFEDSTSSVYSNFVKPSISGWLKSKSNVGSYILPAMQIHSVLISMFFETYLSKIDAKDREWFAKSYKQIFDNNVKQSSLESRIITVTCANVMLQHAYYTSLLQVSSIVETKNLVDTIVDYVLKDEKKNEWYTQSHWDGTVLGLESSDSVKLACWKLLSDEWFESVSRHVDSIRAEKIASVIYSSLTVDMPPTSSISAQLLNTALLRSANFYEAQCFKNCNIQTILKTIRTFFKTKLSSICTNDISKLSAQMISSMDLGKAIAIDQKIVASLSVVLDTSENAMDEDINSASTENVLKIWNLLKLLLLFPNEYYDKNERPQLLYIATLIDIWSVSCFNADPVVRMKVSLMCRSLQLRFIGYFSVKSILGMDSKILNWLISTGDIWPSEGSKDLNQIANSLQYVTNEFDLNILRKVMSSASGKNPDVHSTEYLQETLKQRVAPLGKTASYNSLEKAITLLKATNITLANRKPADYDMTNIIYATEYMAKISQHVVYCLEEAKSFVSKLLVSIKGDIKKLPEIIVQNKFKFENIKLIFHLTRLLQEYARIVGPDVDEVISAENISLSLTALASPFIEFLQSTLLAKDSDHSDVLHMTTEFIAAFCSILSRYQKVETTKRVLAAIWYVYSLVLRTGDIKSVDTLSNAFGAWIQSLSTDQYAILIESFIEQSEEEADTRADISKDQHHLVFLSLFSLLLKNCNDNEKSRLRKQIPTFILKLSLIAGRTSSLQYLQQMMKLLIQLTGDQSYHFSDYDFSLVLSCLLQVGHPTALERFRSQMTREIAHELFDDVCLVLSNFISQHKEQTISMMPPFIALVQSLLHCFKSTHVSLVSGTDTPSKKRKHNAEQKSKNTSSKIYSGRIVPLLFEFTPLDDSSAQRFARLLTTIPQKQHSATTVKNVKSAQTLQKIISKHTPTILIEYFNIQSNISMSVVQPSTKSILTQALYDILDLCSDSDRTFILSCLDGPGKALFKSFYTNWKDNHKYTGQ